MSGEIIIYVIYFELVNLWPKENPVPKAIK
jgi:hypothetical protein